VPGLRREETALLCGISPTWYTWIEQGRTVAVSVETLQAIANGLHLSRAERSYLFELASRADPSPQRQPAGDLKRFAALVQSIRTPAYVLDRHWGAIAWNKAAAELFTDWLGKRSEGSDDDRNLLRYVFLDKRARRLIVDWEDRARRLVAEYRADTAGWRDDPVDQVLVHELCSTSAAFETAWRLQQVQSRDGGLRSFRHAKKGLCLYEQFTLQVAQHTGIKLTLLIPRSLELP
jgi:transcriptional regulator with XRE-family HTH domain